MRFSVWTTLIFLWWLQLLKKAITYVFAESPIRNAEVRDQNLLCSVLHISYRRAGMHINCVVSGRNIRHIFKTKNRRWG